MSYEGGAVVRCRYCGEEIQKDSCFCYYCGKEVARRRPQKSHAGLIVAVVAIVVLAAGIAGLFILKPWAKNNQPRHVESASLAVATANVDPSPAITDNGEPLSTLLTENTIEPLSTPSETVRPVEATEQAAPKADSVETTQIVSPAPIQTNPPVATKLSDSELEAEIAWIRDCYYSPTDSDERLVVNNGTDGWNYSREYSIHNNRLIFAFIYDGTEEHRLYFKDNQMIRYIDENHITYDLAAAEPYGDWAERAVKEAYALIGVDISTDGMAAPHAEESLQGDISTVSVSSLPQGLNDFLAQFNAGFFKASDGGRMEYDYQSASNGDSNILYAMMGIGTCIDFSRYPGPSQRIYDSNAESDPRGWRNDDDFDMPCRYVVYDSSAVTWIAENIFNVSSVDMAELERQGEANRQFYKESVDGTDYYYVIIPFIGISERMDVQILSAQFDGRFYYIQYEASYISAPDSSWTYYAVLERKQIDGKEYWSLYSHGRGEYANRYEYDIYDVLDAYEEFLSQVHHEDIWTYDIEAFWLYDINEDGIPDLFTHGGGQDDYCKLFAFRDGVVDYVWWGASFEPYADSLFGVDDYRNDQYELHSLYRVTQNYDLELVFRYVHWLEDGSYSMGENALETSERVSYDAVKSQWTIYIQDDSIREQYFLPNNASNRNERFAVWQ